MTQWEYLRAGELEKEELNQLGLEGWELVSVILYQSLENRVYFFKRELQLDK